MKTYLTNILVRFYHDCTESYVISEELRLLPRLIKGVIPGIGACVYARYEDGYYYRGFVVKTENYMLTVKFVEIDGTVVHDGDDLSAVIMNLTPQERQVKKYFKVIAHKSEGTEGYHPGKVIAITGNPGYRSYMIKFEDGGTNKVTITSLLLMPKAPYDGMFSL